MYRAGPLESWTISGSTVVANGCRHCLKKQQRPKRIARAVAVNYGFWTKAIALPRLPWHFHSCSQAPVARWRYPLDGLPWTTESSLHSKEPPPCTSGRGMQHVNVKNAVASQAAQSSPLGQPFGVRGAMPQASATSRTVLLKETLCIFLDSPPSPYAVNLLPGFIRRQQLLSKSFGTRFSGDAGIEEHARTPPCISAETPRRLQPMHARLPHELRDRDRQRGPLRPRSLQKF